MTDSLTGVPANNPPSPSDSSVKKIQNELKKAPGSMISNGGIWAIAIGGVLAVVGAAVFGYQENQRRAKVFVNRELSRVQRSIGRPLTEAEARTLAAQYLAFYNKRVKEASEIENKNPDILHRAADAMAFLNSL